MINKRHIAWSILLLLFSQQSLATMRSIIMMTHSSQHYIVIQGVDCIDHQNHHSDHDQHYNKHQGYIEQHCQQSRNDSNHSHDVHHCEHCISGCHFLLFICSELHSVDIRSVNASIHYFSFVPSAPINDLFRPPISV